MFKYKKTKLASEQQPVATPKRRLIDERDVLRARDAEVRKAAQAVTEIAAHVARLEGIITDAEAADRNLQAAIAQDGGQTLAAFSKGEAAPDSDIGTLLANVENATRAAAAARPALPRVQAQLANAQQQLESLRRHRETAVRDFMMLLANEKAREYQAAYVALCKLYDDMRAVDIALPPVTATEAEIMMTSQPIQVPSWNLPATANSNGEWIATKTYPGNENTIQAEAGKWRRAVQRLMNDTEADVSDLLEDAA